eukprot:GHVT01087229.1.p2 GENE.GHVT01087229.1~~GHVT01087229.1.p2  ORF type:complete len:128 (+),score=19.84 GHVT01087229.1:407-790(+)
MVFCLPSFFLSRFFSPFSLSHPSLLLPLALPALPFASKDCVSSYGMKLARIRSIIFLLVQLVAPMPQTFFLLAGFDVHPRQRKMRREHVQGLKKNDNGQMHTTGQGKQKQRPKATAIPNGRAIRIYS